ncbi:MAG: SDR family NAD(P)-dependent oxidoreductase [Planctomycetaceae bacterium]|nr:SDR family NAD(P)-dependent oxidoreductase [Planctomycetaceae bacterium]
MTTVVITGVSQGLGRAMVAEFARQGFSVCGCSRSADKTAGLRQQFESFHRFDEVDVSSDAEVSKWASEIIGDKGPPQYLINNAAVITENASLWDVSATDFDRLMAINVSGTANVIRHFVPSMIQNGQGTIINFSSGWGRSVSAKVAPYCASKWAIEGLTQALAEELPQGLIAVPLNPGIINTQMLQSCFGEGAHLYPTPEEWAARAVPFIINLKPTDSGQPLSVPD